MAPGLLLENVAPLGYLLVSRVLPEVPGTELLYYGVDRLPAFCPTYGPIREFFGEPPEQDPIVAAAIDEWHAIADEPYFSPITPDYEQALRLMSILGQRAPLEMVFCELAWGLGQEKWLSRFRPFFGQPKDVTFFLRIRRGVARMHGVGNYRVGVRGRAKGDLDGAFESMGVAQYVCGCVGTLASGHAPRLGGGVSNLSSTSSRTMTRCRDNGAALLGLVDYFALNKDEPRRGICLSARLRSGPLTIPTQSREAGVA